MQKKKKKEEGGETRCCWPWWALKLTGFRYELGVSGGLRVVCLLVMEMHMVAHAPCRRLALGVNHLYLSQPGF